MTRLSWGSFGERFYEAGVDRGVLYIPTQPGVAWNGLASVSENPSGGRAKPYYLDGMKYLNLSTNEEYEATLIALSSPSSFGVCEGNVSIHNGLIAAQQPRRSFGFCYRTNIGNDSSGIDLGYKLHLVYNALAAPSPRPHRSFGGTTEPTMFSWNITTKPPEITGMKPTAHLIIDSRSTDPEILSEVEDLLYGIDDDPSTLPTPDELIAIFTP